MKSKNAFTLVEVMIVVVIIGLLAAMIIPTIQKVKENNIIKKQQAGQRLTPDEIEFLKERDTRAPNTYVSVEQAREIIIDGKTYLLIEKR